MGKNVKKHAQPWSKAWKWKIWKIWTGEIVGNNNNYCWLRLDNGIILNFQPHVTVW